MKKMKIFTSGLSIFIFFFYYSVVFAGVILDEDDYGNLIVLNPDGTVRNAGTGEDLTEEYGGPFLLSQQLEENSVTPEDPIDQTIIDALHPSSQEELNNYRDEVNNYIDTYSGRNNQDLWRERNYWIGQFDYWRKHPFIDGFISGPDRVVEAALRLIALNQVIAEKKVQQSGISPDDDRYNAAVEGVRYKLNQGSLMKPKVGEDGKIVVDEDGKPKYEYKDVTITPEAVMQAIKEKVSHYSYQEAVKWWNYWQSQYNYWVRKTQQNGGVVVNDGIFNAGNQIDAAVLYLEALTQRINQIRQQYGVRPISVPDVKSTQQLGFSTDSFEAGKHHTPDRSLSEDITYWYTQLHTQLGNLEQTQMRRDYARGVLHMEINYLLQQLRQKYSREQVMQYLRRLLRVSEDELNKLLEDIGLNAGEHGGE